MLTMRRLSHLLDAVVQGTLMSSSGTWQTLCMEGPAIRQACPQSGQQHWPVLPWAVPCCGYLQEHWVQGLTSSSSPCQHNVSKL